MAKFTEVSIQDQTTGKLIINLMDAEHGVIKIVGKPMVPITEIIISHSNVCEIIDIPTTALMLSVTRTPLDIVKLTESMHLDKLVVEDIRTLDLTALSHIPAWVDIEEVGSVKISKNYAYMYTRLSIDSVDELIMVDDGFPSTSATLQDLMIHDIANSNVGHLEVGYLIAPVPLRKVSLGRTCFRRISVMSDIISSTNLVVEEHNNLEILAVSGIFGLVSVSKADRLTDIDYAQGTINHMRLVGLPSLRNINMDSVCGRSGVVKHPYIPSATILTLYVYYANKLNLVKNCDTIIIKHLSKDIFTRLAYATMRLLLKLKSPNTTLITGNYSTTYKDSILLVRDDYEDNVILREDYREHNIDSCIYRADKCNESGCESCIYNSFNK